MSCPTSAKAPCCCDPCIRCYDSIPDTLAAKLIAPDCPCADGVTIALHKTDIDAIDSICSDIGVDDPIDSTPRWSGTGSVCGDTFCMCLRPCEADSPSYECDLGKAGTPLTLFVSAPGGCAGAFESSTNVCEDEASCCPTSLRFKFSNALLINWCPNEMEGEVEIKVTS